MLEVLQFVFSGFWTFVGCFVLLALVGDATVRIVAMMLIAAAGKK